MPLRVQFLFYPDCPSHEEALDRLRKAMEIEDVQEEVEIVCVESEDQAREQDFRGSPTIRLDGQDISPETDVGPAGLSCRVYYKADGTPTPLPPLDLLRDAIRRTRKETI